MSSEIEQLRAAIARAVRRVCPGWLAAERDDIAQEACLRVARKLDDAEETVHLGASYLWRAAHSAVMDEIRRRRRRPEAQMEHADVAIASTGPSPEQARAATELREAIGEGLDRLPPARRAAVLLFLLGHDLRESARVLGWTVKRADNQRYQGLAALRAYLRERGYEP